MYDAAAQPAEDNCPLRERLLDGTYLPPATSWRQCPNRLATAGTARTTLAHFEMPVTHFAYQYPCR